MVDAERKMLIARGHEVEVFSRSSDEIRDGSWRGKIKGGLTTIANPFELLRLRSALRRFRPDIVHIHNTFPLISPLILPLIHRYAPCVMTLHNYRTVCAAGIPMRNGKVCTLCLDKHRPWDALKYRCYRGSLSATLPLCLNIALYWSLKFWTKYVTRFIVLSEFQKGRMTRAGLPGERISVKGNFCDEPKPGVPWEQRKNRVVYVGRLSDEKGVQTLLKAWRSWSCPGEKKPTLMIIGDGDARERYERLAIDGVEFMGQLPHSKVLSMLAESILLILPSEGYETFGLVVIEAASVGTASLVSDIGALPFVVEDGVTGRVFRAGDELDLAAKLQSLLTGKTLQAMGEAAQRVCKEQHTEAANCRQLAAIYKQADKR